MLPFTLQSQQQDTMRARQDSIRRQDSLRVDSLRRDSLSQMRTDSMRQDSVRRLRTDSLRQDSVRLLRSDSMRQDSMARMSQMQQPPVTSDMRIPVTKESGEPMRDERADSIAAADRMRRDSIARAEQRTRDSLATIERARADSVQRIERMRTDSIAAEAARRTDSIARADSLAAERERQLQNRYRFGNRGWYVGLAGGGSMPNGDLERIGYNTGWGIDVPIGWHAPTSALGWRLDLGYDQFSGASFTGPGPEGALTVNNGDPRVLSAALNVTLRAPLNASRTVALYALGGGGIYHFRNLEQRSALSGVLGDDVFDEGDPDFSATRNKYGVQGGAGIDFGSGPISIYVESRFVNVFANRDEDPAFGNFIGGGTNPNLRWIPIVLGVNIR